MLLQSCDTELLPCPGTCQGHSCARLCAYFAAAPYQVGPTLRRGLSTRLPPICSHTCSAYGPRCARSSTLACCLRAGSCRCTIIPYTRITPGCGRLPHTAPHSSLPQPTSLSVKRARQAAPYVQNENKAFPSQGLSGTAQISMAHVLSDGQCERSEQFTQPKTWPRVRGKA